MKKPPKTGIPFPDYSNHISYDYYEDVCYDFGYGNDKALRQKYTFSGNANIDHYDDHLSRWTENDIARDINEGHPTPVALTLFNRGDLVRIKQYIINLDATTNKFSSSSPSVLGMIIEIDQDQKSALVINGEDGRHQWWSLWELEMVSHG